MAQPTPAPPTPTQILSSDLSQPGKGRSNHGGSGDGPGPFVEMGAQKNSKVNFSLGATGAVISEYPRPKHPAGDNKPAGLCKF